MARTLRYRRKRGTVRRRGVTKTRYRRRLQTAGVLHTRRAPVNLTNVRIPLKRRAGQLVPGNLRVRRRRFNPKSESEREKSGGFYTGQYDKYAFKFGRKRTIMQHLAKLDKRNAGFSIERFGACNRLTDVQGAFPLFFQDYSAQGQLYPMPMYLLSLDATYVSAAQNQPFWRILRSSTTNAISFQAIGGVGNDGSSTVNTMSIIKDNLFSSSSALDENYIVEWSNVKFLFKCPRGRSGYVKVQLVQFPEVDLQPLTSSTNDNRNAHYDKLLKELLYSPITTDVTPVARPYGNGMRVLKQWTKNFSPGDTGNEAQRGQQIRMDLFLRHNRYVNRQLRQGHSAGNIAKLDDDGYTVESESGTTQGDRPTDPRARLFLLISGTNFDAPQTEFDALKHISFDMEFRGKRVWGRANGV